MNSDVRESASILIADDEESFREATSRLLKREGFRCQSAEDAESAIESLQDSRFDVLIADTAGRSITVTCVPSPAACEISIA